MVSKTDLEKFFEKEEFNRFAPFDRHDTLNAFLFFTLCEEIKKLTEAVNTLKEFQKESAVVVSESIKGRKPKTKEE